MEFTNFFTKIPERPRSAIETFVLILSPLLLTWLRNSAGPRHAERLPTKPGRNLIRLWRVLIVSNSPSKSTAKSVENHIASGFRCRNARSRARADSRITELLAGKQVTKAIVVPGDW